jgi:hypothetical protein
MFSFKNLQNEFSAMKNPAPGAWYKMQRTGYGSVTFVFQVNAASGGEFTAHD